MAMTGSPSRCFVPDNLYDLSQNKAKPQLVWGQNTTTLTGIEPTKITLAVAAQAAESIDEFIRRATKHIRAMGFLAVSEHDEMIIDRLVARQHSSVERKLITRRA